MNNEVNKKSEVSRDCLTGAPRGGVSLAGPCPASPGDMAAGAKRVRDLKDRSMVLSRPTDTWASMSPTPRSDMKILDKLPHACWPGSHMLREAGSGWDPEMLRCGVAFLRCRSAPGLAPG